MTEYEFITLEGIEGVGKSTAIRMVKKVLESKGRKILVTREPGGTAVGEKIREILLSKTNGEIVPISELFLLLAARAQHLEEVVSPALASGKCVICDRFFDATFAYQGAGRGIDDSVITVASELISPFHLPTTTILLDAPPEVGLNRIKVRAKTDRFEEQNKSFFERIRTAYLERAKDEPERFSVVDASQPIAKVSKDVESLLLAKFK